MLGKTATLTEQEKHSPELLKMRTSLRKIIATYPSPSPPISASRVAIFTVERKVQLQQRGHLKRLGLEDNYFQKNLNTPDDILLRIIKKILNGRGKDA